MAFHPGAESQLTGWALFCVRKKTWGSKTQSMENSFLLPGSQQGPQRI